MLGVMTGFALVSQGVLSLLCFALVVLAFWKVGWKIGLLEILLIFVATNIGHSVFKSMNGSMNRRIEGP